MSMSLTLEDVFYHHERSRRTIYSCTGECNGPGDVLTNKFDCHCYEIHELLCVQYLSGDYMKDERIHLQTKGYLAPWKDTCSLCLDLITTRKNAYLTPCGHTFHSQCFLNYEHHAMCKKNYPILKCPMCRCQLGFPPFYDVYNIYCEKCNGIDYLENYWHNEHDYTKIHMCLQQPRIHYLGMNNQCDACLKYRQHG
jgi:hypothetical protein